MQILGTSGKDVLNGTLVDEIMRGFAGDDYLYGAAGDDVMLGGRGCDVLTGGSGEDRFLFTAASDSYRTAQASHSDLIVDFQRYEDHIDLAQLGYTGFGDGTGHTLTISYSPGSDRAYLKDLVPDAQGHRFEIAIKGDVEQYLTPSSVIFAKATLTSDASTAPDMPLVVLSVANALHHDVAG